MFSPIYLLAKIPYFRKHIENEYNKRAKLIVKKISPFVNENDSILDIGTGTGFVVKNIIKRKRGVKTTHVDVKLNPLCQSLPVLIYNGKTLPLSDNSVDLSLIIAVLHHCSKPREVLDEAIRVSSKRIIIMEDLFESKIEKLITLIMDSIVNWEFGGHPHSNKSEEEWLKIFKQKKLEVVNFETFKFVCAGFPFRLGIFVLDINSPKRKR